MNEQWQMCELHDFDDLLRLSEMERLLEARGIETDVWPGNRGRRTLWAYRTSRLMVRCRDLVYARWVVYSAGLDAWPQAG